MYETRCKVISLLLVFSLMVGLVGVFNIDTAYAAAKKIHLKKTVVSTATGKTYQQKLIDKNGKTIKASSVKWKSLKKSVAKISKKGEITAVKKGTAKMTAKYRGKTYKFTVKVSLGKYSVNDVLILKQQGAHASEWTDYISDEVDLWESDDFRASSRYLAEIKSDLRNASDWLSEARKITRNRKTRNCETEDALDSNFTTWDGMLKKTITECNSICSADVSDLSYVEKVQFAMKILNASIDINVAYLEFQAWDGMRDYDD